MKKLVVLGMGVCMVLIIIHWYDCRYWRSDFTWSSLGGT